MWWKCIHCGETLPQGGECMACIGVSGRWAPVEVPLFLTQDLQLDRRAIVPRSAAAQLVTVKDLMPPPLAQAPAPKPAAGDVRTSPARLWRRGAAFVIDATAVLGIVAILLSMAAAVVGIQTPTELRGFDGLMSRLHLMEKVWIPGAALGVLLATVYCFAGSFLFGGRTLGRAILGIRLVDGTGFAPAPVRALSRAVLALPSVLLCFAGFWWALFDRKGQTWHDKLTATYVVRP